MSLGVPNNMCIYIYIYIYIFLYYIIVYIYTYVYMSVVWHGGFLTSNQHSCPCESWRPCVCKLVIKWLATKEKLYKSQPKTNQQSKAAHWLEFGMGSWNFTKIYQNKTKRWMNMVHSWKSLAIPGPDPFSCWKVYAVWKTFILLISNPKGETRENHPNSETRLERISSGV